MSHLIKATPHIPSFGKFPPIQWKNLVTGQVFTGYKIGLHNGTYRSLVLVVREWDDKLIVIQEDNIIN